MKLNSFHKFKCILFCLICLFGGGKVRAEVKVWKQFGMQEVGKSWDPLPTSGSFEPLQLVLLLFRYKTVGKMTD